MAGGQVPAFTCERGDEAVSPVMSFLDCLYSREWIGKPRVSRYSSGRPRKRRRPWTPHGRHNAGAPGLCPVGGEPASRVAPIQRGRRVARSPGLHPAETEVIRTVPVCRQTGAGTKGRPGPWRVG